MNIINIDGEKIQTSRFLAPENTNMLPSPTPIQQPGPRFNTATPDLKHRPALREHDGLLRDPDSVFRVPIRCFIEEPHPRSKEG